jgi:hypothetical protein
VWMWGSNESAMMGKGVLSKNLNVPALLDLR